MKTEIVRPCRIKQQGQGLSIKFINVVVGNAVLINCIEVDGSHGTARKKSTKATDLSTSLVTILIPVFNGERFISQTIQSVRDQSHGNFEIIVINDGSSDTSEDIILQQAGRWSRGRFDYIVQENKGKVACVNKALRMANGRYFAIVDHDDVLPPQSIELRAEFLDRNPDAAAVYGDAELINGCGEVVGGKKSRPIGKAVELIGFFSNPIASCSVMYRMDAMTQAGAFDERIRRLDDVDRNIQIFLTGPMSYLPMTFFMFRRYRRKDFARIRLRTCKEFALLAGKYFPVPLCWYVVIKQFFFQAMKFVYDLIFYSK
jgi:glycosyltransferase involved in cell wall biosynthesis